MNEMRSNSAAEVAALLEQAKGDIARGIEYHRKAREAIVMVRQLDPKMSNRRIAEALGRSHRWVNALLQWDGTDGSTPFAGMQYVKADADDSAIDGDSVADPILQNLDVVEMGEHVLVVGDATKGRSKLMAMTHAHEAFGLDLVKAGATELVLISDPPYGQGKVGIANDDRADWSAVYNLFNPRGGFAFCAFHPPYFREAEDGIIKAGGVPKHYLAFDKGRGHLWGGDRLQNRLDAIIYFERNGAQPWETGRHAVSLLRQDLSKAATIELKEMGGGHKTPKPVAVIEALVRLATEEGGFVFDPFTGSGTTLIACCRTNRRFIGVELMPKWAERAVRNWMRETGKEAIVHRESANGAMGRTSSTHRFHPTITPADDSSRRS